MSFLIKPSSKSGNVLIFVLGLAAFVGVVFYFSTGLVGSLNSQRVTSKNQIQARLLLNSILDYAVAGVKSKWCFGSTLLEEACTWDHQRSVQRLLLTDLAIDALSKQNPPISATRLDQDSSGANYFEVEFLSSDIQSAHVLYPVFSQYNQGQASRVQVKVSSFESTNFFGNKLIDISVSIGSVNSTASMLGLGSDITTRARVAVFPRELNTYALVVSNSLRLDMNADEISSANGSVSGLQFKRGDAAIPASLPTTTGRGVVFQGPVYVNSDLVLPELSQDPTQQRFSNVTFGSKVVLGGPSEIDVSQRGGRLMNGSAVFRPSSWGGVSNRFYSQLTHIRGFSGGVEQNYIRDHGLDFLSGSRTPGTSIDKTAEQFCIASSAVAANPAKALQNAALLTKVTSTAPGSANMHLALTDYNRFQPWLKNNKQIIGKVKVSLPKYTWNKNTLTLNQSGFEVVESDLPYDATTSKTISIKEGKGNLLLPIYKAGGAKLDAGDLADAVKDISDAIDDLSKDGVTSDEQVKINEYLATKAIVDGFSKAQELSISVSPHFQSEHVQPQQLVVGSEVVGVSNVSMSGTPIDLDFMFYDLSYGGEDMDQIVDPNFPASPQHSRTISAQFNFSNKSFELNRLPENESFAQNIWVYSPDLPETVASLPATSTLLPGLWLLGSDVSLYDENCKPSSSGDAFGSAGWASVFRDQTRDAWKFNPINNGQDLSDANLGSVVFSSSVEGFHVVSIAKTCVVRATVNILSGFFTCDEFIVEDRSGPLLIMGTVILGGVIQSSVKSSLNIHPNALINGVTFRNIYHPDSLNDLRAVGILKTTYESSCNSLFASSTVREIPFWHPFSSMIRSSDTYSCLAVSLREKADPFKWTQVDPDCGLVSGGANRLCKNQETIVDIVEISRELAL